MTPYELAVKGFTDALRSTLLKGAALVGGTWTPPTKYVTPWPGTGRYESLPCRGCGRQCDPARRWCPSCCEVLP